MNECRYFHVCEQILNHFKENKNLSHYEFWDIYQEEVRNQMRRDQAELEGGKLDLFEREI